MNYIFGNNTLLYSRTSRGNTGTSHSSVGPKQKQWAKKGSTDELRTEPSRWQQIVAFFTRRHGFIDCISVAASSTQVICHILKWLCLHVFWLLVSQKGQLFIYAWFHIISYLWMAFFWLLSFSYFKELCIISSIKAWNGNTKWGLIFIYFASDEPPAILNMRYPNETVKYWKCSLHSAA